MKNKFIYSLIIFSLTFCILPIFASANEQVLNNSRLELSQNKSTASTTPTNFIPPIIYKIKEAKSLLQTIELKHTINPVYKKTTSKKIQKSEKTISSYSLTSKEIALAILDPSNQQIVTVIGNQQGKNITFDDSDIQVKLTYFNGVNSRFLVNKPEKGIVIALKYLISKEENGSKTIIERNLSQAVYVPYSPSLVDPGVTAYGADYLNNIIKNVSLSLQNTPSTSIPGKTVTEAIPPAMIKALVYAEHTDTNQVLSGNVEQTINQLNTLFAINEQDTYKYSVSTAGARGIAQFIPNTYASLVKRRSEALLIPDFVEGMSDHTNSIKAMYLLLDDYAGAVRVKAPQGFVEARVFEYGAASYNGGTTRISKAVNLFGQDWTIDHAEIINSLQNNADVLEGRIQKQKISIKNSKEKKQKAFQILELEQNKNSLFELKQKITEYQSASLRNETVNYLNKIFKVITVFNSQQI